MKFKMNSKLKKTIQVVSIVLVVLSLIAAYRSFIDNKSYWTALDMVILEIYNRAWSIVENTTVMILFALLFLFYLIHKHYPELISNIKRISGAGFSAELNYTVENVSLKQSSKLEPLMSLDEYMKMIAIGLQTDFIEYLLEVNNKEVDVLYFLDNISGHFGGTIIEKSDIRPFGFGILTTMLRILPKDLISLKKVDRLYCLQVSKEFIEILKSTLTDRNS